MLTGNTTLNTNPAAQRTGTEYPGGTVVLEMNIRDYSLAHVARIVEDNGAKILSSHVTFAAGSSSIEVTLKLNCTDITSIVSTFMRYEYTVKASLQSSNLNEEVVRSNYDQLMMYLNV